MRKIYSLIFCLTILSLMFACTWYKKALTESEKIGFIENQTNSYATSDHTSMLREVISALQSLYYTVESIDYDNKQVIGSKNYGKIKIKVKVDPPKGNLTKVACHIAYENRLVTYEWSYDNFFKRLSQKMKRFNIDQIENKLENPGI